MIFMDLRPSNSGSIRIGDFHGLRKNLADGTSATSARMTGSSMTSWPLYPFKVFEPGTDRGRSPYTYLIPDTS